MRPSSSSAAAEGMREPGGEHTSSDVETQGFFAFADFAFFFWGRLGPRGSTASSATGSVVASSKGAARVYDVDASPCPSCLESSTTRAIGRDLGKYEGDEGRDGLE
jgi:hypothetical protein